MRFRVIQLVCFQHCWERGQKMLVKLMVGQKKAWEFGGVLRIIQWLLDHVPSLATSPEPQSVCLLGYASSLVPPCSPGNGWSTPVTWVCAEQQWSAPSSSPRVIAAPLDRLRPMLQRIKYTRSTLLKMRQKTENRKSYKISCPLFLSPFSMRSKVFKFNTVINMWRCHVQNNTCLDEKGHFGKKNGGQIGWQDNRSQVQRHGWGGWCKLHNTIPTPKKYCELISTPSSLFCNILGRKWWCIQPQSCCIGLESRKPSMLTRLRLVLDFVFTCQHSNTLPSKRFFLALWFLSHGVSVFRPELDTRLPTQERIPGPHSWQQANVLTPSNYFFSQKEGFITPPKAVR